MIQVIFIARPPFSSSQSVSFISTYRFCSSVRGISGGLAEGDLPVPFPSSSKLDDKVGQEKARQDKVTGEWVLWGGCQAKPSRGGYYV